MPNVKTSDESAATALDGSELVRIVQSGANAQTTTQDIADLGGGAGLFGAVMSAPPTEAGTGMTTHAFEAGATVADKTSGVLLTIPNAGADDKWSILSKAAPATPYSIKALLAMSCISAGGSNYGLGFYDGTKLHVLRINHASGAWLLAVTRYTNRTTWSSEEFTGILGQVGDRAWLRIRDDGTTVYFEYSASGDDDGFQVMYSVAKASGHLGAAGYSNVFWGGGANGAIGRLMLLSFTQGS